MRKKAKAAAPFSHAEFGTLPYSVQRKYFSSLERLRIAEQHELESYYPPISSSSRPSSRTPTPSAALHRSLPFASTRRRLRKAESVKHEHSISQADAHFFLSLPDKVRKQHFSREEQVLLLGRCDHPHLPHDQLLERAQQRFDDFRFDFLDDPDSPSEPERGRSRRRSSSVSSSSSVSLNHHKSVRRHKQQQEGDTRSSLLYLDTMSPPLSYQAPPASGFRRTLSLTNMPLRNSTSSAPAMTDPSLFSLGPWHQRSHSQSASGRRSSHAPTTPVFDPEATHYRDPEARKKLRMFLASPQKFDEAVEFGFPSATEDNAVAPRNQYQLPPIKTDARNFSRDMQTFLKDDKMSFLEDNEEEDKGLESDADSLADLDSPITPSSIGLSFRCHTRHASPSNFSSLDSTGLPPMHSMNGRLNREMTLRMTLTRPDLRADEDQLYGWQGQKGPKDDPFALEELNLSEDMTGSKGPFYIKPKPQGNLVSRLFKRASRKGR